jgi:ABC-type amino acid transport substrate-binding protein
MAKLDSIMNSNSQRKLAGPILAVIAIILSLWALLVAYSIWPHRETGDPQANVHRATLYERVLQSGVLRVGYTVYPPGVIKGADGKPTGIAVDVLNEVASRLNLKAEWTEEVGWATQIEGLDAKRYDIIGTAVWPNPKRARLTTLSKPLFYSPLYFYARSDENRFPAGFDLSELNKESVRISAIEGATAETIVKGQFPKAQRITLPQTADVAQSFLDLVGNKADLVITEPWHAKKFLNAQPGAVKNILPKRPLRVFGNCYMFARDETAFENMLNVVIEDLHQSGFVEQTIRKYETAEKLENALVRVAPDYNLSD